TAFSQQRFEGSLVGGVVLAQIDGDQLAGFTKFGFQAGAKVETILTDRWSFGVELLYTQHGSRRGINDPASAAFERIDLNLVEAPLMVYFKDWKFKVGAGLSYGRIINFEATDVFGTDVTNTQDFREDILLINLSVGYQINEDVLLDVRWSKYLTNLQADSQAGTFLGRNIAIRGIYIL
ncbi:MAG: hypothetical protein AAF242_16735, partial [Bacteroidota bacterium]